MKSIIYLTLFIGCGVFASCAISPRDMTAAVQSARTPADHQALAGAYQDESKEMEMKADLHKKLLAQYIAASGLNSREAHNLIDHCDWLIRIYQQAAERNASMAASHHRLAAQTN
jgi:endonuclease III